MDHQQTTQGPAAQSRTIEDTAVHPEHIQVVSPGSGESGGVAEHDTGPSSTQNLISPSAQPRSQDNPYPDFERVTSPPRSRDGHVFLSSGRRQTLTSKQLNAGLPAPPQNATPEIDWIVPVEKGNGRRTLGERLQPTIDNAVKERDKYAQKSLWTGYALNIAIGLQVFLGALTTGLAAALPIGKQAQVSTSILGGLSTMAASYLARARGSGEPELSITRVKDIEQFLRECRAFQLDHAHEYGGHENIHLEDRLAVLRRRFEELLGNANGERRLSPVGITSTQAVP
ncbi:hypothetical protein EV363DRAFT_1341568 [Boletus edulis]|nr:hypothetical protein EV363DRAFT_1341568 [Boletus edulis]